MTRNATLTILQSTLLSTAVLVAAVSASSARICPLRIDAGAAARARAVLGPSAPQSIAAQLHFQPTAASVAAAEARLAAAHGLRTRGGCCRR
jgi:hypothetical protein